MVLFPGCPCCGSGCEVADSKPRTDPANEGTWVPSGTWRGAGGVTWAFTANPGDDSGETWFFYGSASTSKAGGGATGFEQQDWGNICNWYSNKTTSPSTTTGLPSAFDKRAARLPPVDAVVHIYTPVNTFFTVGPQTVQYAYFWALSSFISGSEITSTAAAHDSVRGAVFNDSSINQGIVNGGAVFNDSSFNVGTVNGGAVFNDISKNSGSGLVSSSNLGIVNGGAVFNDSSENFAIVNGGAVFNDSSNNLNEVNGGAVFNDTSDNRFSSSVNGGAVFNDSSDNLGIVNGGAVFNHSSNNFDTVNGGATFNDSSKHTEFATVNGGAVFNDAACSERKTGSFFSVPCDRKFVAHPTDLPTCNGSAPDGCASSADTCGCG